ncbi:MAG: class I SAM-dependent methyltransferase [Alphaproteobacteria bacterium]|nr:MAG: class I SAM-dependent methyltransferase [Alphaproteobacteria bacterium]
MGFYDDHILPHLIDWACGADPVMDMRRRVVPAAEGQVVEIGLGSGHNLPFYDAGKVKAVIGVDPSGAMLAKAAKRAARARFPVEMAALEGEHLPFEDGFADSVVVTYSLCTIPEPAAALAEMRRVLKPGGQLLFAEHGAAPDEAVRRWQDRLDRLFWPTISGGCHLARHPDRLIEAAGFAFTAIDRLYLPKTPRPFGFNYVGVACPR